MNVALNNGTCIAVQANGSKQVVIAVPTVLATEDARRLANAMLLECEEADRRLARERDACD